MATRSYLGLGANLGDRLASLRAAVQQLADTPGVDVVQSSRVYETEPVGGPEDQPAYLNAVIEVLTTLEARELLNRCLKVESVLGREREERWGPRVIDIDVLTYGDEVIAEPDLEIPHPRMHQRMFVLAPLFELDADPPLPGGRRVATMRLEVLDPFGVRPFAPPLIAVPA